MRAYVYQMLLVERRRTEPALKEMAGLARAGIDEAGVEAALSATAPEPGPRRPAASG